MLPGNSMQLNGAFLLAALVAAPVVRAEPMHCAVPKTIEEVSTPDVIVSNGVPTRIRAVKSAATFDELAAFFVMEFRRANLFIPPRVHQKQVSREISLSALDVQHLIGYTVFFQPNADKTTTVIVGQADLAHSQANDPSQKIPLTSRATHVVRSVSEAAVVVAFETPESESDVRSFYDKVFRERGFQRSDANVYERNGDRLQMVIETREPTKRAVTLIAQGPGIVRP